MTAFTLVSLPKAAQGTDYQMTTAFAPAVVRAPRAVSSAPARYVERWLVLERTVAAIAVIAVGTRFDISHGVGTGLVVAALLLPVWSRAIRLFSGMPLFVLLGMATLISGVLLSEWASANHQFISHARRDDIFLLLGVIGGIGLVLWARTLFSDQLVGLLFGIGMGLRALNASGALTSTNPFKFGWAIPVAVVVLSLVHRGRGHGWQILALVLLAAAGAVSDARSNMATCVAAAFLLLWQARPRWSSRRANWGIATAFLAVLGVVIYYAVTRLLVNGYLGAAAQTRSVQQIQQSGSLIVGGRPELAATAALLRHFPMGFGPGIVANGHEIMVAKEGFASINYDPNNGYVDNFMFGGPVELHSTFGDLWAHWGLVGLAFAALILLLVVRNLSILTTTGRASGLVAFLGLWTVWNMFFSPFLSATPTLILGLGLLLFPRGMNRGSAPVEQGADPGHLPLEVDRPPVGRPVVPAG